MKNCVSHDDEKTSTEEEKKLKRMKSENEHVDKVFFSDSSNVKFFKI